MKIRSFTQFFASVATVVAISVPNISQAGHGEEFSHHGTDCQPAFLGQAINRGLGWSNYGIGNDPNRVTPPKNPSNLFVQCNVRRNVEENASDAQVKIYITTIAGYTPVPVLPSTCIYRQHDSVTNAVLTASTPMVIPGNVPIFPDSTTITTNFGPQIPSIGDVEFILCKLAPGQALLGYRFQDDVDNT